MSEFPTSRRSLLKTTGVGVVGVSGLSAIPNSVATVRNLSYGETVSDRLSTSSPFDEDFNGYHETYTFVGKADDVVSLEMRPDTEDGVEDDDHAPELRLYDPDGDGVARSELLNSDPEYGGVGISHVELEMSGTYTVVATTREYTTRFQTPSPEPYEDVAESHSDTFAYELRLHEFYGEPEELTYNTRVKDALDGESNFLRDRTGYYDTYSFAGEEGDVISLEMRPDTEDGAEDDDHAPRLELYDPDGDGVARSELLNSDPEYGGVGISHLKLEMSGTYTVVATTRKYTTRFQTPSPEPYEDVAESYFDTFAYDLRLHELFGEPEELTYDTCVTDALDGESNFLRDQTGYYDTYSFAGEEGDVISLEMRPNTEDGVKDDDHAPRLRVYGPDGDGVVTSESLNSDPEYGGVGISHLELEMSGTYTVVATTRKYTTRFQTPLPEPYEDIAESYFDTFAYELRLHELFGERTSTLEDGDIVMDALSDASHYQRDGFASGYYNVYTFEATAGQTVSVEARVSIPDQQAAQLRLYDPDSELIAGSQSDAGATQLDRVEIEDHGHHTLIVGNASTNADVYDSPIEALADTFQYELRFYEFVGERDLLTDGDTVQSTIEPTNNFQESFVGYYDTYVTTAMENDTISLEMNIDQADDNAAKLIVLGPDGDTVTSTTVSSGHATVDTQTLPDTGEYTIIATSEQRSDVYDSREEAEQAHFQYQLAFDGPTNNPPLVDTVSVEPRRSAIEETVNLVVDAFDPNGGSLEYEWEQVIGSFPDPEVDIINADAATATFEAPAVDAENELTFTVELADEAGGAVNEEISLVVDPDEALDPAPSAVPTVTAEEPLVGEDIMFDGSHSTAPETELVDFEWVVDGPESVELAGETATHSVGTDGEYDVTLTVTDETGQIDTARRTITVDSPKEPSATLELTPNESVVDEEITFDASDSTAPETELVDYEWAVDGPESLEFSGETTMHSLGTDGEYNVTLTVTDDVGQSATGSAMILVTDESSENGSNGGDEDGLMDGDEDDSEDGDDEPGDEDGGSETADDSPDTATTDAADDGSPGFGVGGALTAIGGAGYLLQRRLTWNPDE